MLRTARTGLPFASPTPCDGALSDSDASSTGLLFEVRDERDIVREHDNLPVFRQHCKPGRHQPPAYVIE